MKVELGVGLVHRSTDWLEVDINPRAGDLTADALRLPFRDGSIEALRAVDVLEHLSYRDTDRALAEWARVCAAGADLYVQVPDAEAIMWAFFFGKLTVPADLPQTQLAGAAWRLMGGQGDGRYVEAEDDWRWNAHFALFSRRSLEEALETAGFHVEHCTTNGHPNLCATAVRQ